MADINDLISALTRGGPAEGVKAATQGFQAGQAQVQQAGAADLEIRKAAFKKKLDEAGVFSVSELGDLPAKAGLNLAPDRKVSEGFVQSLPGLKTTGKPKSAFEEAATKNEIDLAQSAINNARAPLGMDPVDLSSFAGTRQALKDLTNQNLRSTGIASSSPELSGQRAAQITSQKEFINQKNDSGKAQNSLTQLRTSAKLLGDFESGVFNQLKAKGIIEVGKVSADPQVVKALGLVGQQLGALARGPFAERGVLTEQDIERVRDGLGNPSLPLTTKLALINSLEGKLMLDNAVIAETAGKDEQAASYRRKAKQLLKDFDESDDPIDEILKGTDSAKAHVQTNLSKVSTDQLWQQLMQGKK